MANQKCTTCVKGNSLDGGPPRPRKSCAILLNRFIRLIFNLFLENLFSQREQIGDIHDKYCQEENGEVWRVYYRQKMLGYSNEERLRMQDELGRLKRNNV